MGLLQIWDVKALEHNGFDRFKLDAEFFTKLSSDVEKSYLLFKVFEQFY